MPTPQGFHRVQRIADKSSRQAGRHNPILRSSTSWSAHDRRVRREIFRALHKGRYSAGVGVIRWDFRAVLSSESVCRTQLSLVVHVVHVVEERRSQTWVTIRTERCHVSILRTQFGRHFVDVGPDESTLATVRVAAPTSLDLARKLAGWGSLIDVVEPRAARHELARIGPELVASHSRVEK